MGKRRTVGRRDAYKFYVNRMNLIESENNQFVSARNANSCKSVHYEQKSTTSTQKSTTSTQRRTASTQRNSNKSKGGARKQASHKRDGMTYSQKKRASFNYRNEYFKKNPGIYGSIWFCSQCGKMLVGKKNVVIDHIVPLNNVAGVNRTFNTVAICQKCNSSKSDKVDYRVVKGYLAKVFEVITSHLPDALALVLSLIVSLAYQIFNLLFILFTMPLTALSGNVLTYVVIILIFCIIIYSKNL